MKNTWMDTVNLIKYKSEKEIEATIEELTCEFERKEEIGNSIKEVFVKLGKKQVLALDDTNLIKIILLGFVLADIKNEMDPIWRQENIFKIVSICASNKIEYELVNHVSSNTLKIIDIVREIH